MAKIKVRNPLVEMDGDEMTRVMWALIKQRLILPHLELDLKYYDLGIQNRDRTGDQVTVDAAHATREHGVAVKCATVTHDAARLAEFGSPEMLRTPNGTIRGILDGTLFREPIICRNVPRLVPHWDLPVVMARHAFGDLYRSVEFRFPGPGRLTLTYQPDDGGPSFERQLARTDGAGVALAMYNLEASIIGFARACLGYGLMRGYPVYFSTKDTILKTYDGRFRTLFEEVFAAEFADRYRAAGLTYEHRLIDDMVASSLKWRGGYLWACKNYDGDVQSDSVAQGYGSLGLMTSVLMSSDGEAFVAEAAHGTVTRHYRDHLAGRPTSTNPVASIFAWTRGLTRRGEIDATPEVTNFAGTLERVCVESIEAGHMTRDLAQLAGNGQPWESTESFLATLDRELRRRIG
jgi:isocitrate dehydrogenase